MEEDKSHRLYIYLYNIYIIDIKYIENLKHYEGGILTCKLQLHGICIFKTCQYNGNVQFLSWRSIDILIFANNQSMSKLIFIINPHNQNAMKFFIAYYGKNK